MRMALIALIGAGVVPLLVAVWSNRRTSLLHALVWALLAWLCWGLAFLLYDGDHTTIQPARYCALCLTGCAGIAVLGARRPHVFAWDSVVLGLFVVMTLPLVETSIIGARSLDGLRIIFLSGAIAVGILNYVPTRRGPAAICLGIILAGEIAPFWVPTLISRDDDWSAIDLLLTCIPWLAWMPRRGRGLSNLDRLWLSFRDRWGFVWSQRVREQFNLATKNAGWPVTLGWNGLTPDVNDEQYVATLRAVLQRFVEADQNL